jgi:hypothetical protein
LEIQIDEGGNELSRRNPTGHTGQITEWLMRDNCVNFDTATIRRRCVDISGYFDESLQYAADYEFWLRLSLNHQFAFLPQYFTYYRTGHQQISRHVFNRFEANWRIIDNFFRAHGRSLPWHYRPLAWSSLYSRRGNYRRSINDLRGALGDHSRAALIRPYALAPWRALGGTVMRVVAGTSRGNQR